MVAAQRGFKLDSVAWPHRVFDGLERFNADERLVMACADA